MTPYGPGRPHKYDPSKPNSLQPPAAPGEYRIRNHKNQLKYIGIASDLKRRMKQHILTGEFDARAKKSDTFEYQLAKPGAQFEDLCRHERSKIALHNPLDNKRGGGGGRRTLLSTAEKHG